MQGNLYQKVSARSRVRACARTRTCNAEREREREREKCNIYASLTREYNKQANRRDIRHIFLTNVVVRDTSELEALKKEMLKVFRLYCI